MASPSKKLRISPIRASLPLTLVTSTPRRSSRPITSPQVSCIPTNSSGGSMASRSTSTKSSITSTSLFIDASESDSFIGNDHGFAEDYEIYFQNIQRIKYVGRIWNLHRPLVEHSLYGEILTRPSNAKERVEMFYHLYQQDQKKAIQRLIKFAVDVSGFQKLDIPNIKDLGAVKGIIHSMESIEVLREQDTLKKTGKCLLQEMALVAKPLQMGIYYFIDKLVMVGYENKVLFDGGLFKKFLQLVKLMSDSKISPVKFTGTVFALKITTAAVKLYARVQEETDSTTDSDDDTLEQLRYVRQNLDDLINLMYMIFHHECGIADSKLMALAIECLHEMKTWVQYFPKKFISDYEIVKHLRTISINPSKAVRLEALVVCESFVSTRHIWEYLKSDRNVFLGFVADRFYDVDMKISIKAIDVFIALLKQTNSETIAEWMKDMVDLIFDKLYPIGSAACKFWSVFFNRVCSDSEQTLLELMKLTKLPNKYAKELVVEGFLPHCSILLRWDLYVNLLMDDHSQIDKHAVAALFSEVLCQTLTGKPTVSREKSITEPVDLGFSEHSRICDLLPHFNKILLKQVDNPTILKDILRVIPALNPVLLSSTYAKDCITMWNNIQELYAHHTDESLLEALADALFFFHTTVHFTTRAVRFCEDFNNLYTNRLRDYLEHSTEEELSEVALKIAVLYPHANLNSKIDWQKLFLRLAKSTDETTAYLEKCCAWYLIWDLRKISKEHPSSMQQQTLNHKKKLESLLGEIFRNIRDLNENDLHYKVYNQLCDFLIKYQEEVKAARKSDKTFDNLKLDLQSDYVRMINDFLDKYVIYKKELTLGDKQKYFADYINLTNVGVISLEHSAFAYKYYLEFNDEFGEIIERSMQYHIKSEWKMNILLVVSHTLMHIYEAIMKKYTLVPINSEEFNNLRRLVKKFLAYEYFRKPIPHFMNLLLISIRYAFQDRENLEFLYVARYFVDILCDKQSKIRVQNFFVECKKKDTRKNQAALYFWNYLKSYNVKESPADEATSLLVSLDIQETETTKSNKKIKSVAKTKTTDQAKSKEKAMSKGKAKSKGKGNKNTESGGSQAHKESHERKITKKTRKTTSSSDDLNSIEDYTVHDSTSDDLELTNN